MTIVCFVEGATRRKGGIGLVGVPLILKSTATRGHRVALIMAGPPNPGREDSLVPNIRAAFERKEGAGVFGIVAYRALATWAFAPAILWQVGKFVRSANCVSLHSVYSFPVLAGYLLARFYGKPYGIWLHGVYAPFQRQVSARLKWLYDRLIGRRIIDNASVIFYSARGEREEARGLGLKPESVIVPHGIDISEFAVLPPKGRFRERFFPGSDGELIVFIARLNAKKGLDILVNAMVQVISRRPSVRLAIIGPSDPPAFKELVLNWIREHDIAKHTVVTGSVGHELKLEALADADVFVSPSQAENFGFSIFEAMASRIPVVVSNTLNYAGEIAAWEAGFSVPREPASFANAILNLLENPALRRQMGNGAVRLASRYSWESTGAMVERTFTNILQHRPVPEDLAL